MLECFTLIKCHQITINIEAHGYVGSFYKKEKGAKIMAMFGTTRQWVKSVDLYEHNWASEASPTLGCSIEISRDIYIYYIPPPLTVHFSMTRSVRYQPILHTLYFSLHTEHAYCLSYRFF